MSDLSRQNGARWEAYIRAECRALANADLAFVSKNWEAPKVRGSEMKWEPSKPDFSGFLCDGRHVVFEAKAMLSPHKSFPFSRIAQHQWDHLTRAHEAGAVAFLYLLRGDEKWVIPWDHVIQWVDERASFPLTDCTAYPKLLGETWLDTFERIERIYDELWEEAT